MIVAEKPDEDAIFKRAVTQWHKAETLRARRKNQSITFQGGRPVCIVFAADQHFGDDGTNYPRAFEEVEIVRKTQGMYLITVGDIVNNFVIGKLRQARDDASIGIQEEWILAKRYLRLCAPKLLASVAGNHDNWSKLLAGIDYFKDIVKEFAPNVIYDSDDARIMVRVGKTDWMLRIRHQWEGASIYNPTHAIERAAKWDNDFVIGVGAHTHVSGVARSFNVSGVNGLAVLCGTYKEIDPFARKMGFPKPNTTAAVAVIFDEETHSATGFDNIAMAAKTMQGFYRK